MENVKEVIEKYRREVMSSYPSIFTKEDVVQLLSKMEVDLSEVNFDGGSLEYYKETLIGEIRNIVNEDDIQEKKVMLNTPCSKHKCLGAHEKSCSC